MSDEMKKYGKFAKEAEQNLRELAAQVKDGTFSLEEAGMMQAGFVMKNHPFYNETQADDEFRIQRNQIALQAGIGLRREWM